MIKFIKVNEENKVITVQEFDNAADAAVHCVNNMSDYVRENEFEYFVNDRFTAYDILEKGLTREDCELEWLAQIAEDIDDDMYMSYQREDEEEYDELYQS